MKRYFRIQKKKRKESELLEEKKKSGILAMIVLVGVISINMHFPVVLRMNCLMKVREQIQITSSIYSIQEHN